MDRISRTAYARAGLLGNPSDGYEGKAIAFIIRNFSATVTIEPSDRFELVPGEGDSLVYPSFADQVTALEDRGCYGGIRLLRAAIKRFTEEWSGPEVIDPADPHFKFRLGYQSDIPRQAGMAGSSAIIIAGLRALGAWFGVEIEPARMAEIALAAEVEDLRIAAGPMDRVTQTHEGVLFMDFALPRRPESYRRIEPSLLPPLFIAWDPRTGQSSGIVHSDVRARWLRGDPDVREAIAIFPKLAEEGLLCLQNGDSEGFRLLVDRNFDTRAAIWTLSRRDREMVAIGRKENAAVKFCGSGGAVVGVMRVESDFPRIEKAYAASGYQTIRPVIEPALESAGEQRQRA